MNLLRSIFISSYMTMATIFSILAGRHLYQSQHAVAWSGVLLTTVPTLLTISRLMIFSDLARTSARFPLLNLLAILGVGLSFWSYSSKGADLAPSLMALFGWLGFIIYAYWYSSFYGRSERSQLAADKPLPKFSVSALNGDEITSTELTNKPTILIFYRGNWCPLCVAQIKEMVNQYQEIDNLGVRVAFISPQPQAHSQQLAKKFDTHFEFYTDVDNRAARSLGIAQSFGVPMGMQLFGYQSESVLPTVIITDATGTVVWLHETDNYRVRPEPETYLKVLKEHL